MNYQKLYIELLVKHGHQEKPSEGYFERHHIIPRWQGGEDSVENLVYITARVHFLAHWILYKIHNDAASARALFGMVGVQVGARGFHPKRYEIGKRAFARHNHMKQEAHKARAREVAKRQWEEDYEGMRRSNAYMFRDPSHPMYMTGKTGDNHPRSRAVFTPLGRFGSVREAAKAHGIPHPAISKRCKEKVKGYYYEDGLSPPNSA